MGCLNKQLRTPIKYYMCEIAGIKKYEPSKAHWSKLIYQNTWTYNFAMYQHKEQFELHVN